MKTKLYHIRSYGACCISTGLEKTFNEAISLSSESIFSKYNLYLGLVSGLIAGCVMLIGLDLSYILPAAVCDLELTASSKAMMSSSVFIGTMSACHISGLLIDVLGRRYVITRSLCITAILYVLIAFAPNFITFAILKGVAGFVLCPSGVALFVYIGESCPDYMLTNIIIFATTIASCGITYSTAIAWLILPSQWSVDLGLFIFHPWRLYTLVCGLPILISAFLMYNLPESPKYLLASGKKEEALKILKNIYHINTGLPKKDFPVKCLSDLSGEKVSPAKNPIDIFKKMWAQTFPLFLPPYVTKVLYCSLIYFTVYFYINGVLVWVPEITNRMSTTLSNYVNETFTLCEMMPPLISMEDELLEPLIPLTYVPNTQINASLISNSSSLSNLDSEAAGFNLTQANTTLVNAFDEDSCVVDIKEDIFLPNLLSGLVQPVAMICVSLIMPLFKKKKMAMLVFLIVAVLLMIASTLIPNSNIIIGILTFMPPVFGVVYNIITSLTMDFFPTNYRGMATSLGMLFGRIGSVAANFSFSYLLDYNCSTLFYGYIGILILAVVVSLTMKTNKPTSSTGTIA